MIIDNWQLTIDNYRPMIKGWLIPSYRSWLLLVLLTAVFLRLHHITTAPPGLTHDEADHGISAWGVVNGERPIYFSIGYGREPFYDYATAILMSFLGPTYLAGRLTAVFFGLILVAGMAAWSRQAFDAPTALYTTAGLAVSFWPVMTSRHMLRSVTMPTLFVIAMWLFWWGLRDWKIEKLADWRLEMQKDRRSPHLWRPILKFLTAGVMLGLTFYTYIPARILWGVFPCWLGYLWLTNRPLFRRVYWALIITAGVAIQISSPLFLYLYTHPEAETRIAQLSQPLWNAFNGNFAPLKQNTLEALRLFTVAGDSFERYNLPGQPLLPWIMGIFFYLGVITAVWYTLQPRKTPPQAANSSFALLWLLAGFSPALITGTRLSTTQTIGMQPVVYLLVAVGMGQVIKFASQQVGKSANQQLTRSPLHLQPKVAITLLLFTITAVFTYHRYFTIWANLPAVRVQYETTMVEVMNYLNKNGIGTVAISTITPEPVHSPAVAAMTLHNEAVDLRWFDGNHALLLPQNGRSTLIFSGFAPLNPALQAYFNSAALLETLPLRETDLDRPLTIYQLDGPVALLQLQKHFSLPATQLSPVSSQPPAIEFLGYDLQTPEVRSGEVVQLATLWRVIRPLPEANLFAQVLQSDGVLAQDDRLDIPATNWHSGDIFIQLHQFTVPLETAVGSYLLITGLYDPTTKQRLPVLVSNQIANDYVNLAPLTIAP